MWIGILGNAFAAAPSELACQGYHLKSQPISAGDLKFTESFLWEVLGPDPSAPPSYLFGVVHGVPEAQTRPWDWMYRLVQTSRLYVSEIPMDAESLIGLAKMQDSARDLSIDLSTPFLQSLRSELAAMDIAAAPILKKEPWAVYSLIGQHVERGYVGVDQILHLRSEQLGTPRIALESTEELENHFVTQFTRPFHIDVLKDTLCSRPEILVQSKEMIRTFIEGQPRAHAQAGFGLISARGDRSTKFRKILLNDRNKLFAQRLDPELRKGGVFAVMGALHLMSDQGLLALLEGHGFRVRPVDPIQLKDQLLANADVTPIHEAIDEAIRFLKSDSAFATLGAVIPPRVVLVPQMELDQSFCGGANCQVRASYKDGALLVSPNLLVSLLARKPYAQGVITHEITHYLQELTGRAPQPLSCQTWKDLEVEALMYQGQYLQKMGLVLSISGSHYGKACTSD